MRVKREDFKLLKFKKTNAGVVIGFTEKTTLANGVQSTSTVQKSFREDPHPELVDALQDIGEIVMYDEDYKKGTEIVVTGITIFPEIECAILSHLKETKSGKTVRNSGRISKESETYQKAAKLFDMIDILENEAFEYVYEGKRAQLALFDANEEEQATEPEDNFVFPDDLGKEKKAEVAA